LRWAAPGEKPVAELEIDRPSDEASEPGFAIAARMDPKGRRELEAAGVIDSRFGPVTLLRLADEANDAASRLGFIKHLDEPNPRISGWSCQGSDMPARRALKRPRRSDTAGRFGNMLVFHATFRIKPHYCETVWPN
jgi:hypothetical protein